MIHESYGDDLDMTTDDEDTNHGSPLNSPSDKISTSSQIQSNDKYDVSLIPHFHQINLRDIFI